MITVKCTYGDGDEVVTRINATFEEAVKYYVGQWFNVGTGPDDNMQQCTAVELVEPGKGLDTPPL